MNETTNRDEGGSDGAERRRLGRRALLGSLAAVGIAGCLGQGGNSSNDDQGGSGDGGGFHTIRPDTETPTSTPEPTPTATPEPTPTATAEPTSTATAEPTPTQTPEPTPTATPEPTPTAQPTTTAGPSWTEVDDPYYSSLQDDLAAMGVPPGEFVYAQNEEDTLDKFETYSNMAETSDLAVSDDLPFSAARRVTVTETPDNPWNVTMRGMVTNRTVSNGDVLLGVVYLRGPPMSEQDPTIRFVTKDEDNEQTNMVPSNRTANPSTEWTRYYVPMEFQYSAESGTWWWELFHGYGKQTTDVGGMALIDFDQDVSVDDLPSGPVESGN